MNLRGAKPKIRGFTGGECSDTLFPCAFLHRKWPLRFQCVFLLQHPGIVTSVKTKVEVLPEGWPKVEGHSWHQTNDDLSKLRASSILMCLSSKRFRFNCGELAIWQY